MADVFISYKREELSRAAAVAGALESEGFSVFYDLGDQGIQAGEIWDKRLEHELSVAGCCVVLWSPESVASDNVRSEARRAKERGVLVPAQIIPCRLPLGLDSVQAVDLSCWTGERSDPQWRFLVDRGIGPKLGRARQPRASVASSGGGARNRKAWGPARLAWFVAAAAVFAVAAGVYWSVGQRKPQEIGPAPAPQTAETATVAKHPIAAPAERPDRPPYKARWQNKYEELFLATDAEIAPYLGNWCFKTPAEDGVSSAREIIFYLGGAPNAYYFTAKYADGGSVTDTLGPGQKKFVKPIRSIYSLFLPLEEDTAVELSLDKKTSDITFRNRAAGESVEDASAALYGRSCN